MNISMFFWDATIGMNFFRLFPTIAIVVVNNHRQRSFAQVYCVPMLLDVLKFAKCLL